MKSLESISKLPDDVLKEIAKWINEDFEIESRRIEPYYFKERVEKVNNICIKCEISEEDFFNIFSFTTYIIRRINELSDDMSDVVSDFVDRKLISDESKEKVLQFFRSTESKSVEIAKQSRKDTYEAKSLPILDDMDYSVQLRLVPKNPFESTNFNIEDYRPEADDLVLSSIIELITDDGKNKNVFSFQLNFTELEGLIVRLQACQKEMRLLQTYQENNKIK